MKKVLLSTLLILNVSLIYAESPGSFRGQETHGLGFGIEGSFPGSAVFYDYAINSDMQLHVLAASGGLSRATVGGSNSVSTSNTIIGTTLRYFPSENFGWYIGAGAGLLSMSQTMKQTWYCFSSPFTSLNPTECSGKEGTTITATTDSTYSGLGLWADLGWQGYDGFYFTIGATAGTSMKLSEDDKTAEIMDISNHQATAKGDFDAYKSPTGLIMSFGWHF